VRTKNYFLMLPFILSNPLFQEGNAWTNKATQWTCLSYILLCMLFLAAILLLYVVQHGEREHWRKCISFYARTINVKCEYGSIMTPPSSDRKIPKSEVSLPGTMEWHGSARES